MKIEDIELCATYWTVSGAVYPGAPSEVSPFPLKDRAEVSGRVGWRGMGFVLDDMEASIARYGLPTVRRIFSGQRHPPRRARVPLRLAPRRREASRRRRDVRPAARGRRRAWHRQDQGRRRRVRGGRARHPGDARRLRHALRAGGAARHRHRHRVPALRQHQHHRPRARHPRRARHDQRRAARRHLARRARRHDRRGHPQDPAPVPACGRARRRRARGDGHALQRTRPTTAGLAAKARSTSPVSCRRSSTSATAATSASRSSRPTIATCRSRSQRSGHSTRRCSSSAPSACQRTEPNPNLAQSAS